MWSWVLLTSVSWATNDSVRRPHGAGFEVTLQSQMACPNFSNIMSLPGLYVLFGIVINCT